MRCCGIPFVPGRIAVQLRFLGVQPAHGVTQAAEVAGKCRGAAPGTAKIGQQQVGGGAVAIAYRRIAKLPDRHPGLNVLLGHRGDRPNVVTGVGDQFVQMRERVLVQHRRHERRLERGAECEPLIGAVFDRGGGAGGGHIHPKPGIVSALQLGEAIRQIRSGRQGCRCRTGPARMPCTPRHGNQHCHRYQQFATTESSVAHAVVSHARRWQAPKRIRRRAPPAARRRDLRRPVVD
ncbi:Uncharacterised protein [Mycobacterium tuberculosis]|uniref:Uncharacterized protein n=1 Tax=Mycobacterium tuberculosis TaxID=1773 RepID=A0A655JDW5_MYCTX|nr:Uncharacterised protein [Mycobacterium tuberculosis]CKQ78704.1 Uncharacterised protein [Mycobacterium tuberculosis]CKT90911.1 Uncharacterised protein [Mycobacterium tuberculosis]CKU23671.1 Uncharacterised protein [Mycobacterium tuberculosis]CNV58493.1 Uncharacterised protein [Mycobacterium tuberculosis]